MNALTDQQLDRLRSFASLLVDQHRARVIVPPQRPSSGHWFGGGNMVADSQGRLWLVGRYRNRGDSRTGLGRGERGLELAIFCSSDQGANWTKRVSFAKSDLHVGEREVLSIEGTALRMTDAGVELYLSTEKTGIEYPPGLESYLKPGTGVWTIDRIVADRIEALADAPLESILGSDDPQFVQVKDPFLYDDRLMFCTHPFCWTSSNTGYANLDGSEPNFDFFPRGFTWDVAMTRGTTVLPVPHVGDFSDQEVALMFYDGGECVRDLDEHESAVKRPRGYSCEELGGLAYFTRGNLAGIRRLSITEPMFVSPRGTGCSRYVDVLATAAGFYATWQQSQADRSQPLVMNFVSTDEAMEILTR